MSGGWADGASRGFYDACCQPTYRTTRPERVGGGMLKGGDRRSVTVHVALLLAVVEGDDDQGQGDQNQAGHVFAGEGHEGGQCVDFGDVGSMYDEGRQ